MRKVLFLDFDGVICTPATDFCIDASKLDMLEQIVAATNCDIVISSSWRRYTLDKTIAYITDSKRHYVEGNPFRPVDKVIDITSRMYAFKYGDSDKHYKVPRGVEIDRWLKEHKDEVATYCIVDDDADMLLCQAKNFVQTDDMTGLTDDDVHTIIRILNDSDNKQNS